MNVTYSDLIQFCTVLSDFKGKKKISATTANSDG